LGFEDQWPILREKVTVELIPGTLLMRIKAIDADPQRAKLIADETARQLSAAVGKSESSVGNRAFVEEQAASFPPKIEAAQEEIRALEADLSVAFSARQIQDIQNKIRSLEGQIYDWQNTFADYQLLLGEGSVNYVRVLEKARVPTIPIGPTWIQTVLLAAGLGCLAALGAVFLLHYLDDTLKSPDDVAKATGLTTLGSIITINGKDPDEKLVTMRYPKSPISEAYRAMRTNLQFSSLDQPLELVVITSADPGDGKSTTAANLAVVMAQAGHSVVLVDSDLRKPMVHKIFKVPNRHGLTTVLLENDPILDGRLQETGIPNLRVLTSGPLPPNPSEMLGSKKMRRIMAALREEADLVLFDTPPALPVTDATVLSAQADGVLLVSHAGKTRRAAAQKAIENMKQVSAHVLGVSLNRISARDAGNYYYYHYYHAADDGSRRRRQRGKSGRRRSPRSDDNA
jgi:non-specific protein-tyrosine kinase